MRDNRASGRQRRQESQFGKEFYPKSLRNRLASLGHREEDFPSQEPDAALGVSVRDGVIIAPQAENPAMFAAAEARLVSGGVVSSESNCWPLLFRELG
jgi:hypothetical protein